MISYLLLRLLSFPLSLLPYRTLNACGMALGRCAFSLHGRYRKRTLNNLALAGFPLEKRKRIAIASFQNLFITIFELARLIHRPWEFSSRATCESAHVFEEAKKKGKGVVLLSSHQTNWEIGLFDLLPGSLGVTIGRPHKNKHLYNWILSMRERNGNRIVPKDQALKEGTQALRQEKFFAFFADQAVPKSPYSYPFFGRRAWTTIAPALLAYRTGSPLCVVTKERVGSQYLHRYSNLIWPNTKKPWKEEVPHMMDRALQLVEESIKHKPGEWLWQHNRWKQGNDRVCKKYRHDFILVVMPFEHFEEAKKTLAQLKALYPRAFFTVMVPKGKELAGERVVLYSGLSDLLIQDGAIQLVFDFLGLKALKKHFLKFGAFEVLNVNWEEDIESVLCEKR